MKKAILPMAVVLLFLTPGLAAAESGKELLEKSESFDGKQVTFQGEVIGVMIRGDYAWINVLDDGFAIGVWSRAENAKMIAFVGDYSHEGDRILVSGVFHKACSEHGGDLDIHADDFTILARGRKVERLVNIPLLVFSVVLIAMVSFFSLWLRYRRRERERVHYLMEG